MEQSFQCVLRAMEVIKCSDYGRWSMWGILVMVTGEDFLKKEKLLVGHFNLRY
jgi:hypothetical protein